MADKTDDAIAAVAVELNADSKAKRKGKQTEERTHGADSAVDDDLAGGESLPVMGEGEEGAEGFDAEGQHSAALERMEGIVDDLQLRTKGLVADTRDFLLDTIKARPKPWSATSQGEQRDVAAACEYAATELVRKIVEAVNAHGVNPVRILLTKVTLGGDIVIAGKVKTFDAEEEHAAVGILHSAIGKHAMLTVASVEDYRQEGGEAMTDPDEPDFAFEADAAD